MQAMAIYGHMSDKQVSQDDQDPPPDKTNGTSLEEAEANEITSSLLEEAENIMKSTKQESITEETSIANSKRNSNSTTAHEETEQHFTIANSPTRYQHYKDTHKE